MPRQMRIKGHFVLELFSAAKLRQVTKWQSRSKALLPPMQIATSLCLVQSEELQVSLCRR